MMLPQDSEFHARDPKVSNWVETIFCFFSVPEAAISGGVYVLARPNLGVLHSSIFINQGICLQPYDVDYTDSQMHLTCPESFSNFTLSNGLTVEVTKAPGDYHFKYASPQNVCEFDLNFRGLMPPFDTHDPNHNPLIESFGADKSTATGFGQAWANGHMDWIGRVTGTLRLRGKSYSVNCLDGMDHSWGPRPEWDFPGLSWVHVTFGEELGIHTAMSLDIRDGEVVYGALRFGYVQDHGEIFGIVDAKIATSRAELLGMSTEIWVKDVRGREYRFYGAAIAAAPWHSFYPCCVSYQTLYRFHYGDQVGYCSVADIFGLNILAERMSRHGARDRAR